MIERDWLIGKKTHSVYNLFWD